MSQESFSGAQYLQRQDGALYAEGVALEAIASAVGTPCYVYSRTAMVENWRTLDSALSAHEHTICYAVKANSNIAVLRVFAELGSGFDIVSGGELSRVLKAGADPGTVFFSGVGKTKEEIEQALAAKIACFNIESPAELDMLESCASAHNAQAAVAVRVNPDIDAKTHPHITTGRHCDKFGVSIQEAKGLYERIAKSANLQAHGIDCHIGSQVTDPDIYAQMARAVVDFANALREQGHPIQHLDFGGGFAIPYAQQDQVPSAEEYVRAIEPHLADCGYRVVLEPGRFVVGNAGLLLTRVILLKSTPQKNFVVVDAAMNDLLRPALYDAHHRVVAVASSSSDPLFCDVVGPVCETADTLARDCSIAAQAGDLLAVLSAGAYGFSMASHYNTRVCPAEVMVDRDRWQAIRERESVADLMRGERFFSED